MKKKEYDYYVYIDYSERLIGYCIIEGKRIPEILPKISKFAHCKEIVHKAPYIATIKRRIKQEGILKLLYIEGSRE